MFDLSTCPDFAVPASVMQAIIRVESAGNPYAIGVVGDTLMRQPKNLLEAVATARQLENAGHNYSVGLAQVNRINFAAQKITSFEHAFGACANVLAGSRILADCYKRSLSDWPKAFSCYYSGNFETGFKHGYVQKVMAQFQNPSANALISESYFPKTLIKQLKESPLIQNESSNSNIGQKEGDRAAIARDPLFVF